MDQPDGVVQLPDEIPNPSEGQASSQLEIGQAPELPVSEPVQPPVVAEPQPAAAPQPEAGTQPAAAVQQPAYPPYAPASQFVPGQQYAPGQYPPGQYPPGQYPPAQQYAPGQYAPGQYPPAQQFAQGQYAQGQYAQGMYGGQYGQPYPQVGAKKKPIALFVIIGVVVVALIVFCVYWFALRGTPGPAPTSATVTTTPTEVVPTVTPEDAVWGFLQAIQNSDAEAAMAYMADVPDDTTFLTDDVLMASNNLAALTNIGVTPSYGTDVKSVDVSYDIGDEPVTTSFGVTLTDYGYLLSDVLTTVDLSGYYQDSVGMQLNGVSLDNASIMGAMLFPGTYQITMDNPMLALSSDTFTVTEPHVSTADSGDVVLSDDAHAKIASAVSSTLKGCLKEKKLITACGFGVSGNPSVRSSTINWRITSGSSDFSKTKFKLDDTLLSASASIKVSVKVTWTGSNGRSYYINPITIKHAYVDFSDPDNIDVEWGY